MYGNKKLKFASVPSDVYDKPLFRADYERAVHSRPGGRQHKKKVAPRRYGPSAVLIDSDDDRYLVPESPVASAGLKEFLSAPWVSYQKAVDDYLANEGKTAKGEGAGEVSYAGGRKEAHEALEEASASSDDGSVPYGTRI